VETKKKMGELVKRYHKEGGKKMEIAEFLKLYKDYNEVDKELQTSMTAMS
jgi:hypothetical protein